MTLRAGFIGGTYETSIRTDRQQLEYLSGGVSAVVHGSGEGNRFALGVGPGHDVLIYPGMAFLRGRQSATGQGSYFASSDATETRPLPAPKASPFIATVVLRVTDPEYGAVTGTVGARIDIYEGTAATSPVAISDAAISAMNVYGGWVRLGDIRINPGQTGQIPASQFTINAPLMGNRAGDPYFTTSTGKKTLSPLYGRLVWEFDTNLMFVGDGTRWQYVSGYSGMDFNGAPSFPVANATIWGTGALTVNESHSAIPSARPARVLAVGSEIVEIIEHGSYLLEAHAIWASVITQRVFVQITHGTTGIENILARNPMANDTHGSVTASLRVTGPTRVAMSMYQASGGIVNVSSRFRVLRLAG